MQQLLHPRNLQSSQHLHQKVIIFIQNSLTPIFSATPSARAIKFCSSVACLLDPLSWHKFHSFTHDFYPLVSQFPITFKSLKALTGAMFGRPLIAPADPTEMDGSKKSINPSMARKGVADDRGKAAWNSGLET